jgi:hypothetical protein
MHFTCTGKGQPDIGDATNVEAVHPNVGVRAEAWDQGRERLTEASGRVGVVQLASATLLSDNPVGRLYRDKTVGKRKLDLGSVAHCADLSNPCDGRGMDGPRNAEYPHSAGEPKPWLAACVRDFGWLDRCAGAAAGCTAWDRGRGLGRGVFVAWRARLA